MEEEEEEEKEKIGVVEGEKEKDEETEEDRGEEDEEEGDGGGYRNRRLNPREEMNGVAAFLDALLPVLHEVTQGEQGVVAHRDPVFRRPGFHGHQDDASVELLLVDLETSNGEKKHSKKSFFVSCFQCHRSSKQLEQKLIKEITIETIDRTINTYEKKFWTAA